MKKALHGLGGLLAAGWISVGSVGAQTLVVGAPFAPVDQVVVGEVVTPAAVVVGAVEPMDVDLVLALDAGCDEPVLSERVRVSSAQETVTGVSGYRAVAVGDVFGAVVSVGGSPLSECVPVATVSSSDAVDASRSGDRVSVSWAYVGEGVAWVSDRCDSVPSGEVRWRHAAAVSLSPQLTADGRFVVAEVRSDRGEARVCLDWDLPPSTSTSVGRAAADTALVESRNGETAAPVDVTPLGSGAVPALVDSGRVDSVVPSTLPVVSSPTVRSAAGAVGGVLADTGSAPTVLVGGGLLSLAAGFVLLAGAVVRQRGRLG